MTEIVEVLPTIPEETEKAPIKVSEKQECKCGKMITKKQMNAHLMSAIHLKAMHDKEQLEANNVKISEPKKDAVVKVKKEFEEIKELLTKILENQNEILLNQDDILNGIFGEEENEENPENPEK